eukprot:gene23623-30634_t
MTTMVAIIVVVIVILIKSAAGIKNDSSPLHMDVEWILQGKSFGFSGFFVELLGISRAIRTFLPHLRLAQSFFYESLDESPLPFRSSAVCTEMIIDSSVGLDRQECKTESSLLEDLFPEERKNIEWLVDSENVLYCADELLTHRLPRAQFLPNLSLASNYCSDNDEHLENFESKVALSGFFDIGGDLARPIASSAISPGDCCRICSEHPLCTSWNYFAEPIPTSSPLSLPSWLRKGCSLKGSVPSHSVKVPGCYSAKVMSNISGTGSSSESKFIARPSVPRAVVLHGTTCSYRNESITFYKRDINTILIGRYMVERAGFQSGFSNDEYYVAHCSALVDEVWVPTEWHRLVFSRFMQQMGLSSPSIAVIPEAVDTNLLRPGLGLLQSELETFMAIEKDSNASESIEARQCKLLGNSRGVRGLGCRVDEGGTVVCRGQQRFVFLSIFKWEYRKGWDTLLNAYWGAFTAEDRVVLKIRSYRPASDRSGENNITRAIENFAWSTRNVSLSELAAVEWLSGSSVEKRSDSMSRAQVRELYAQAQAFVLPTRGEGWGLPIAEAMAMALPVIITNYSGPTAFATADNSYLLRLYDPPGEFDELHFARPSETHLSQLLRQVIVDSNTSATLSRVERFARPEDDERNFFSRESGSGYSREA